MKQTRLKLPGADNYFTQESFNVLRTNLQFCGQDIRVIVLTSCTSNEGKSYTSLHLCRSLAEIGKKTLLIDADMRKSVMAGRNFDSKNVEGLSEVLTGQADLKDCIYTTQYETLHVLFSGKYPPNPVELLEGKYFKSFLMQVRNYYDYVIIDTPPLGMVIDAAVVAALSDGAILVIGASHAKYPQAQEVLSQLRKAGCNVLGAVLNNTEKKGGGYYRRKNGYGYGYYSKGAS